MPDVAIQLICTFDLTDEYAMRYFRERRIVSLEDGAEEQMPRLRIWSKTGFGMMAT